MRFRLSENRGLSLLDRKMFGRLGENIYLIFSIMSVLFVFSGLVVGLLGRGWAVAWFLVFLGVTLGFLPILHFIIEWEKKKSVETEEEDEQDEESDPDREEVVDEKTRSALEREARLAKAEIKRRNEARKQEEKLRRQEERILRQAREKEYERRRQEEEKRRNKEKQDRKEAEERRDKWNKARGSSSGNVYKGNTQKIMPSGYFDGVKSMDELKKRYKELVKIHHPDNGGSGEEMMDIRKQYEELEMFFKSYEKHVRRD